MKTIYQARELRLHFGDATKLMGILNVTPDSFSDGGLWEAPEKAIAHARAMVDAGAELIDVGGESTRPGSRPVSAEEEIARIVPIVRALCEEGLPLSVDTWKAAVAEAVLALGVPVINDIYGLRGDPAMAETVAAHKAGVILMNHPAWYWPERAEAKLFPRRESLCCIEAEEAAAYAGLNALEACLRFLADAIECALKAGIPEAGIMLDPGIGFGLTQEENLLLCNRLDELQRFGFPVLLAPSRKRFLRRVLGEEPEQAEIGTSAVAVWGVARGADMLRVHDVARHLPYLRMADALKRERLAP